MSVTIACSATAKGRIKQQGASGGSTFAEVTLTVSPTTEDAGLKICTSNCVFPIGRPSDDELMDFFSGIREGVQLYTDLRKLSGVNVEVQEVRAHPVDSSWLAFRIAASRAMEEAVAKAGIIAR